MQYFVANATVLFGCNIYHDHCNRQLFIATKYLKRCNCMLLLPHMFFVDIETCVVAIWYSIETLLSSGPLGVKGQESMDRPRHEQKETLVPQRSRNADNTSLIKTSTLHTSFAFNLIHLASSKLSSNDLKDTNSPMRQTCAILI